MEYGRSLARSQDDEQVNYFCQRPHNDNDFAYQKGHRWAVGDDSIIDVSVSFYISCSCRFLVIQNVPFFMII